MLAESRVGPGVPIIFPDESYHVNIKFVGLPEVNENEILSIVSPSQWASLPIWSWDKGVSTWIWSCASTVIWPVRLAVKVSQLFPLVVTKYEYVVSVVRLVLSVSEIIN